MGLNALIRAFNDHFCALTRAFTFRVVFAACRLPNAVGSRWLLEPCRAKRLTTDSRIPNHPLTPSCIQYTHDPNLLGRVGQVRTIFRHLYDFP